MPDGSADWKSFMLPEKMGLSRAEAAAFIGVSAGKFDEMVVKELMPRPRLIGARKLWSRIELIAALHDLPIEPEPERANSWDRQ